MIFLIKIIKTFFLSLDLVISSVKRWMYIYMLISRQMEKLHGLLFLFRFGFENKHRLNEK
jgi:hypothetical protein